MLFLSNSLHFPLYKSYEAWTLDPRFFEFRIRDFMLNNSNIFHVSIRLRVVC